MPDFPIPVADDSPFPLENIPFGIFSPLKDSKMRAGTAIGQYAVDLGVLERHGLFHSVSEAFGKIFAEETLNSFASLPRDVRRKTREVIAASLSSKDSELFVDSDLNEAAFYQLEDIEMHLPMHIIEFTDFSTFEEHVGNCTRMSNMKLPDNFFYSPMAYNGRTSSIIPSGKPFARPQGVFKDSTGAPKYQPCQKLDYEMEMGILIANDVPFGDTITADEAKDHIFGFVLLNDWSARDIQMYESVPTGPFNSKGFATSLSPWVVVPEAIAPSAAPPLNQQPDQVPTHIRHSDLTKANYDILFDVFITRNGQARTKVSTSNLKHSHFTPAQCIAHRSSSGCGLRTGELLGSGTISSPESDWPDPSTGRNGCLFELTWDGTRELPGLGGTWLEDGDEVTFEAWAKGENGARIGFGQLSGEILPASGMLKA